MTDQKTLTIIMKQSSQIQALNRCDLLLDFHARAAARIDDPEIRNDHFCDAAKKMAAVGMADTATNLLARIRAGRAAALRGEMSRSGVRGGIPEKQAY